MYNTDLCQLEMIPYHNNLKSIKLIGILKQNRNHIHEYVISKY